MHPRSRLVSVLVLLGLALAFGAFLLLRDDASDVAVDGVDAPAPPGVTKADEQPAPPAHSMDDSMAPAPQAGQDWPRSWDPAQPVDFSGVDGVSHEQQARAEQLVVDALRELPAFADVTAVGALGYASIGDAATGFEHYVNVRLVNDGRFLDPTAPESLVYAVDGDRRTLVSAMFIADAMPIDAPVLTDFAGPLMQWHVHGNLCWGRGENGMPVIRGVAEQFGGTCPEGTLNAGGEFPMVHVWIAAHPCGPFAALEGQGAGQAEVPEAERRDVCHQEHAEH